MNPNNNNNSNEQYDESSEVDFTFLFEKFGFDDHHHDPPRKNPPTLTTLPTELLLRITSFLHDPLQPHKTFPALLSLKLTGNHLLSSCVSSTPLIVPLDHRRNFILNLCTHTSISYINHMLDRFYFPPRYEDMVKWCKRCKRCWGVLRSKAKVCMECGEGIAEKLWLDEKEKKDVDTSGVVGGSGVVSLQECPSSSSSSRSCSISKVRPYRACMVCLKAKPRDEFHRKMRAKSSKRRVCRVCCYWSSSGQ